jgi:hypothetical protein
MKITCYSCNKRFTTHGAVVVSPPVKNTNDMSVSTVHKYNICVECWPKVFKCIEHLSDTKIIKEKKK